MPRSKSRKKAHNPRAFSKNGILDNCPLPPRTLHKISDDLNTSLLRMRFSGINGQDLAMLTVFFGQAWLLASEMEVCDELRSRIEANMKVVSDAVGSVPDELSDEIFDALLDLITLTSDIISKSTKREYEKASEVMKAQGAVPFVDAFFETLCKSGLMVIVSKLQKTECGD